MIRQREKVGAFVKVPIGVTGHTYGRILDNHKYAFYDSRTTEDLPIEAIEKAGILFKVLTHRSAVTTGLWPIVGVKELSADLQLPVPLFVQEIGNPRICHIRIGEDSRQVAPEECVGIERFAAWEHHHVEQRLLDYYNGVSNREYEMNKVKIP